MFCREPPWRPYHGHRARLPVPGYRRHLRHSPRGGLCSCRATCF